MKATSYSLHLTISILNQTGIVDSTAKYVAKNGAAFEERIKREHRDKPKFSFLLNGDPFNSYYQFKVKEIRNSLLGELDAKLSQQDPVQRQTESADHHDQNQSPETRQQPSAINQKCEPATNDQQETDREQIEPDLQNESIKLEQQDDNDHGDQYQQQQQQPEDEVLNNDGVPRVRPKLNEYIQEMTIKLEEPTPLNYLARSAPSDDEDLDCDIIKLTAQFIAIHGRSFLLELVSREQNNSQFDFLKPQHGQFFYMTNLIMQYALIRNQPLDILEQLEKDSSSQKHVLDKIKMRAEWNRMLEVEQKRHEEAQEKEKLLYSQIDWHDFVIVETIDYQPDERGEYPPTTADQVGTRLLIQQRYEEQNIPEEMDIDMDVESDQEGEVDPKLEYEQDNSGPKFAIPDLPDLFPPKPDKVVIRRDYDPKSTNKINQPDNYFVSPITNELIPADKIHEHMRYNLSDPRHLEKKDQMLQERMNEEAVFASGSQIQNSLKNLAETRTDIFGANDLETAIGRRIGEEEQAQPKDDRLIWDGHKSSLKKKKLG